MSDRAIRDAILQITGGHLSSPLYSVDAVVVSVNPVSRTCVCQAIGGKVNNILPGVRLMAVADDGFLLVPVVGSNVCVIFSDGVDPYVSQYSDVDMVVMRGGNLGGLVTVATLITKLNNLESKVNALVSAYGSHTHGGVSSGGSSTAGTSAPVSGSLTLTNRSDIENVKITQG